MSTRLRRPLHALALVAGVAVVATGTYVVSGTAGVAAQAAPVRPSLDRPLEPAAPRPTLGERAAAIALREVGVPYRWGGESPSGGFDCSGLVRWAYGRVGVDVPHSSYALYSTGRRVSRSHMKPGDVLVFSGLGHVGLYLGRGRMIHAPYTGKTVEVVRLSRSRYGQRVVAARQGPR